MEITYYRVFEYEFGTMTPGFGLGVASSQVYESWFGDFLREGAPRHALTRVCFVQEDIEEIQGINYTN